ncbi:hypothetical protein MBLNU457_4201t1 [Dothideomycetes sp. NU457]
MRFQSVILCISFLVVLLFSTQAYANSCSSGINVCCGSASISCSGNICKACCGSTCGCFKATNNGCNTQTTPCVNVNKPDFKPTNGECVAPASSGGGSTSGGSSSGGSSSGGGSSGGNTGIESLCQSINSGFLRRLLGC